MTTTFDYKNQAWVRDGKYVRCGHPALMNCGCYGRLHAGEPYRETLDVNLGESETFERQSITIRRAEPMKNWSDIKDFILRHQMQYKVVRFNMSLRGCLVGLVSDQAVAYTVRDAARMLREEVGQC